MLYDNSQLARVYLHAWQLTGDEFYRTIAQEILDYVAREMTSPEGGFFSTQDADSEGEEGKFFVWTVDEIGDVIGEEADEFIEAYGVRRGGNWEGVPKIDGFLEDYANLAEGLLGLYLKLGPLASLSFSPDGSLIAVVRPNGLVEVLKNGP